MRRCILPHLALLQVLILSLQILVSSLRSPGTTNVIKQPHLLDSAILHGKDMLPGPANVCSRMISERAGVVLDTWYPKHNRVFVLLVTVSTVLNKVFGDSVCTLTILALANFFLCILHAGCLKRSVLKRLGRTASFYYYTVSIVGGRIAASLIYGPKVFTVNGRTDALRFSSYFAKQVSTTVLLLVFLYACLFSILCMCAFRSDISCVRAHT